MINEIVPIGVTAIGTVDPLTPVVWQVAAGPNGYAYSVS